MPGHKNLSAWEPIGPVDHENTRHPRTGRINGRPYCRNRNCKHRRGHIRNLIIRRICYSAPSPCAANIYDYPTNGTVASYLKPQVYYFYYPIFTLCRNMGRGERFQQHSYTKDRIGRINQNTECEFTPPITGGYSSPTYYATCPNRTEIPIGSRGITAHIPLLQEGESWPSRPSPTPTATTTGGSPPWWTWPPRTARAPWTS